MCYALAATGGHKRNEVTALDRAMTQTTTYRNALALGTNLLEYRLESVLGAGGFGITYLARDTHLDKLVAIKEYLPSDLALRALDGSIIPINTEAEHDYQWGLRRFIHEARTLAKFSHPHIVRVNRYFEANGTGYMVMDYEQGESLNQYLRREPCPGEPVLKTLLVPLLDGLTAVHDIGFLHRDIKPSNIFLRTGRGPLLLDFGSARQASTGTRSLTSVLTPGFAPLEQYSSDGNQGPWSDIYAMGAVIYRAIVNESPPDAVTRLKADTVMRALDAARDRYSERFLDAVKWAMALDEKQRPQSIPQWRPALAEGVAAPAARPALGHAEAATVPLGVAHAATRTVAATRPAEGEQASTQRVSGAPARLQGRPPAAPASRKWRWIAVAAVLVVAIAMAGAWNKQRAAKERAQQEATRQEADRLAAERRAIAERASALEAEWRRAEETRLNAEAELRRLEAERVRAGAIRAEGAGRSAAELRERPSRDRDDRLSKITADQQQRLRHAVEADFRAADTDGDGYLSRDEVQRRFPLAAREFHRVDTDGDGRISPQEFAQMRRAQLERRVRQER